MYLYSSNLFKFFEYDETNFLSAYEFLLNFLPVNSWKQMAIARWKIESKNTPAFFIQCLSQMWSSIAIQYAGSFRKFTRTFRFNCSVKFLQYLTILSSCVNDDREHYSCVCLICVIQMVIGVQNGGIFFVSESVEITG